MNIQLASDLHLDMLQARWPDLHQIQPHPQADVLVLAGDIDGGAIGIRRFAAWASEHKVPIIYVAGNHEYYHHHLDGMQQRMREHAAELGVHFLEDDSVVLGGVRFLGCTMWTDYKLIELQPQKVAMSVAERCLNDHRLIKLGRHRFSARDALDMHLASRHWLEQELATPFEGKTVVVSHHGPHPLSVHPRYAGDPLSAAFNSDLSELLPGVDLWLHGHVHDSVDYTVGSCRVVANPAGYVRNPRSAASSDDIVLENPQFDRQLLLNLT